MGTYLNPGNDEFYNAVKKSKIYVDKTELLKFTNSVLCGEQKDICVSRSRRFGKSIFIIKGSQYLIRRYRRNLLTV